MKATGIVRRIDDLGRVVIPKEIRRTLRIREGDPSQITLTEDYRFVSAIRDIAEQIAKYKNKILKSANVGDYVVFGSYQQDSKTSNGKEDIAWLVLAKEDNKVLVISRYALDCQPYNTSYTDVTWENCSLRKSLNDTFGCAECVTDDGYAEGLGGSNVDNIRVGVRPAMWIDLGAL